MKSENALLEQIQKLPVLPQVAMRISERMQSPTATLPEIAGLIQSDAGLTSKVLKLANSSYYSIPGGVKDVSKALQYLGFTTIAQIVLTTSVLGSFKTPGSSFFPIDLFWKHSFATGIAAEICSRQLRIGNPSDAFVMGLLHDLGKLIYLEILPDDLQKIIKHAQDQACSFLQAEVELSFPSHVQLGTLLARHWNLPATLVAGIEAHHRYEGPVECLLVAWANAWAQVEGYGHSGNYRNQEQIEQAESQLAEKLGLTAKQKQGISEKFIIEYEKAGAILNGHS